MAFENFNPDNMKKAPTNEIDCSKYEGIKSKIEGYRIINRRTDYDENNKLVPGLQREVPALEVYSEKLGETEAGRSITARESFPLKVNKKTGEPEYSLNEKSKTYKLFESFKVNSFKELIGKSITVITRSYGKDRKILGFNY